MWDMRKKNKYTFEICNGKLLFFKHYENYTEVMASVFQCIVIITLDIGARTYLRVCLYTRGLDQNEFSQTM